ncbi:MAG TPA: hypothetical protein VLJ21_01870, partial [Candidatus Binatia bacterium]|nr:hypothetical protein [Candidatus Binatia bacterium]
MDKLNRLYYRLVERFISKSGPTGPFLVLDENHVVRQAHPGIERLTSHTPKEIEGKHYADFFSDETYVLALQSLAYRMHSVAQDQEVPRRLELLRSEFEYAQDTLSLAGRVKRFNHVINVFTERGRERTRKVPAHDHVRRKDGSAVTVDESIYLMAEEHTREYLGSIVTLQENRERGIFDSLFGGFFTWYKKLKPYSITTESTVSIDSLADPVRLRSRVIEINAQHDAKMLVLDFADVRKIIPTHARALFELVGDRAQKGTLILGNMSRTLQDLFHESMTAKYGKKAPAARIHHLVYPQVQEPAVGPNTFDTLHTAAGLESFISMELRNLERANAIPEPRVR